MNEGLSDNRITSIFQDRDGILWFSTWNGGLNRYDGKSFSHYSSREGFGNNMVVSIMQDRTGKIWFVTYGSGLICYDGKTFSHLTEKEGLPCNDLDDILEDKNGCFWISTDCNGVVKYDGKTFTTFNDKQGLCYNGVLCSLEDEKGNLWFGTAKGLSCFNGKTFTNYSVKDGLGSNWIETILQDRDGIMWFGAREGGVTRYDGTTFMNFTEKEGLCCNDVKSMIQDKNGNLWFGTTMGLSRLSPGYMVNLENKQGNGNERQPVLFTNFTYEDGFHGVGCINKSLIEDKAGTIWIGANDRLTAYHPEGYALDTIPPTIQISGLLVFDEKIPWLALENKRDTGFVLGNGVRFKNFRFDSISRWYYLPLNLSLPHVNNYLTFQFIGITLKQSKKVKYQYKLEGLDDNWSALTSRAEAPYGNIPPGRYTFKVKSMNSEGYWSKEASYSFTIRPPWWRTWWAFSGYILLFIGAIWFTIWSAIENQRKKIRLIIGERNRIARELHDDIGAELTRITMLSQILQKNDKVEGDIREKLRKISETGKKVLGSIGEIIWTMNPQKDNLDSLAAYIRRFVTEYLETNGIDINIEFPAEIPARDISDEYRRNVFLVVKEAISNISKYSKATSVRISLTIIDKLAEVEISDNGTGFSVKEKENWGNGLRNMNQRMKDIGGTFLITSETNRGTLVRLSFPVR
jgi:ligand-binding sensor domain-containing protein/two-component sensor histidine kinase